MNLHKQSPIIIAAQFVLFALLCFALTTLIFKIGGAEKTETTRLYAQAITCIASFAFYLRLRRRAGVPGHWMQLFAWACAGLAFAFVPYIIVSGWPAFHWENLRWRLIAVALVFAGSAAIFEEILFRDILLRAMFARYRLATCIAVQVLIFSAVHFLFGRVTWLALLSLAVSAVFFSFLWLLRQDYVAPMIAHFIIDFSLILHDGIFTRFIARPGLFLGETTAAQIYTRTLFEVLALLAVLCYWRKTQYAVRGAVVD